MSRQIYGVFSREQDAAGAYEELVGRCGAERCDVLVHDNFADATTNARDTRRGAIAGAVIVAVIGAAIAGIAGIVQSGGGLLAGGVLVIVAAIVGGAYGALSGSLSGAADVHADRIQATLRDGKIVVAARAEVDADIGPIQAVLKRHQGVVPEPS